MNPFDLDGPDFLVFYALLAIAVALVLRLWLRLAESGPAPALPLGDPYQIAWLRGGRPEAIRVAIMSLVDRDLLEMQGANLASRPAEAETPAQPEIERAILQRCTAPSAVRAVLADAGVKAAGDRLGEALAALGLVPDGTAKARRRLLLTIAVVLLAGIALLRLGQAFARGHSNVGFLIIMGIGAVWAVVALSRRLRTARGDAALADLRRLLADLRRRATGFRPREATGDVVLVAAVFGLAALPTAGFGQLSRSLSVGDGSSGGSSCGSSDGGGGGSGCGG